MSIYRIKEIFLSVQGEGLNSGRVAVFVRFAGCNLKPGQLGDVHKSTSACSHWCDTNFIGTDGPLGGRYQSPAEVLEVVRDLWPSDDGDPLAVCTGGEPLLQLDKPLIQALHEAGFTVAIESNGTLPVPPGIGWVCISPKAGAPLRVTKGNELKLVYPQEGLTPADVEHLDFDAFILQPLDGPDSARNTRLAVEFCLANPRWRMGLQMHKLINLK